MPTTQTPEDIRRVNINIGKTRSRKRNKLIGQEHNDAGDKLKFNCLRDPLLLRLMVFYSCFC